MMTIFTPNGFGMIEIPAILILPSSSFLPLILGRSYDFISFSLLGYMFEGGWLSLVYLTALI